MLLKPRWRKVLRDLASNKTRTLLVVLSIAVGVTAIGMVMGSQNIIERDLPQAFQAVNPASATVFTLSTFDDDQVENVAALDEVKEAEGRRVVVVRFQTRSGEWRNMQLFAVHDFETIAINKLAPEEGEWPPAKGSILIERSAYNPALGFENIAFGDQIIIEPPNGRKKQLTVTGTLHDLNQFPPQLTGMAMGYISFETLEILGEPQEYNQLNFVVDKNELYDAYAQEYLTAQAAEQGISLAEAEANIPDQEIEANYIKKVSDIVQGRLERSDVAVVFVLAFPPGEHPAQSFLDSMSTLLVAMGGLSLVLSGFLIINTLAAILTQQVRQIGIMKAIGAQTPQLTAMYFLMVLVFGGLSLLIAIPLGAFGAGALAGLFGTFLNFNVRGFAFSPTIALIQTTIGLAVPLAAAVLPIRRGTRTTVQEAISEYGVGKGQFGTTGLDVFIVGLRRIIPMQRPVQISLRNTFRRKGRLILTLITLSLASAIFISILSIRASLVQTLDEALGYFDFDVQIRFSRPYRVERLSREALTIDGVAGAESWGFGGARRVRPDESQSDNIIIYAPPADSDMIKPILIEGRWLKSDDTNAIVINNDVLRSESDVTIGSRVTLSINGREQEWVVVGLVRSAFPQPALYINYDYYGRITNEVDLGQVIIVKTEPGFTQQDVADRLSTAYRNNGYRIEETATVDQIRATIALFFNIVIIFLLFMALLLGVVGGLGLMGTMSINVIERLREIGVMRAIGASDKSVLRIVLLEGIIIGVLSWLIGGIVALPLSKILTDQVGYLLLQAAPSYIFSIFGTGLWLFIVIILAIIASFLPARSASQVTVREVLSYE